MHKLRSLLTLFGLFTAALSAQSDVTPANSAGVHVLYDFSAGDTLAPKDGWSFASTSWILEQVPGSTAIGLQFSYPGSKVGEDGMREMRFNSPPTDEFWLKLRLHIPVNYTHRSDVRIDTPDASAQGWQVGDRIQGADGLSQGTISAVDSTGFFLRNPARGGTNSVWVGVVRNLTRNTTATTTKRFGYSSNNKLLTLWADGYSAGGLGSTIIWEMWPETGGSPGSTPTASNLAVHYSTGGHTGCGPHLQSTPFVTLPDDGGHYIDIVVRGRFSSQAGAKDGIIQTWLRKEGQSVYTRIHNIENADMDKRGTDTSPDLQPWQHGYLMGWSNSGYDETTTFHISRIEYSSTRPADLPSAAATYTSWRAANFSGADRTNDAISGPDADPDGCGLTNLARYAFGLPARGRVANPTTPGTTTGGTDTFLTLTFPRRAVASDLTYTLESSTDLVTWAAVPGRTYTAGSDPITARDAVAIGTATPPRRFLRLRVTGTP